jgi:L-fucose isomerase-like protein
MSEVIERVKSTSDTSESYKEKSRSLKGYTPWKGVPEKSFDSLVKLGVVLDEIIESYQMDAISIRCWTELQQQLGISPCVLLGELNNRLISSACEVDIGNAIAMHALALASGKPASLLDWNNNYGEEDDKCILFHCGPVPKDLMENEGMVTDHAILKNSVGEGCSFGCHVGRIKQMKFTYGSLLTNEGKVSMYVGQGRITNDPIPNDFFGVAGVAEIDHLQDLLLHIGRKGYRHHVSLTQDWVAEPLREALSYYLNFNIEQPLKEFSC